MSQEENIYYFNASPPPNAMLSALKYTVVLNKFLGDTQMFCEQKEKH